LLDDQWLRFGPRHALLVGETVYLGYDGGEWGGGLRRLSLITGEWDELEQKARSPITDLKFAADGKLWVVHGLAHLGPYYGWVRVFDGKTWKTLCESVAKGENWDLPAAVLDALAFDPKGNPWLLSSNLGLIRQEAGKWVRATPDWPVEGVAGLHITASGVAVIGTRGSGVLLFDIKTGKMRRIALREK
jgi:hypothetical protein